MSPVSPVQVARGAGEWGTMGVGLAKGSATAAHGGGLGYVI